MQTNTVAPHPSAVARLLPLWRHKELLWQFTLRNVELRHKGSHLGLIWSILNPLLMLGLYVFVFTYIFNGRFGVLPNETRLDHALGIFVGLTVFHFVSEVLMVSPTIVVANPNFVKKVVFPLDVLPAAQVGAAVFHFLISLALALLGIGLWGPGLGVSALWLPVVILPLVLLCLGLAWLISALGVFLRDLGQAMQFLTLALMFSSAVFYPASSIAAHPAAWAFLKYNPLLLAIELCRDVVMWQRPLNQHHLTFLYVSGIAALVFGHWAFGKMKLAFADVL